MNYNLVSILTIIASSRHTITRFILLGIFAGSILSMVAPRSYVAETIFLLKNPVYADRNNVYSYEAKFLDYLGNDEDIERLIAMASSDSLLQSVISTMHLASVYHFDSTDPEDTERLKKYFRSRLEVRQNKHRSIVLTYKDTDPIRAAAIADLCVVRLESSFRGFYNGMRRNMHASVMNKIHQEDSLIAMLTDSLIKLRELYGIYDVISPSRYNIMLSSLKDNGHPAYARGIELVQNVESIKDEIVGDRAKHISLANQYSTGTEADEMHLVYVMQAAIPPIPHVFRGVCKMAAITACLGLLYGILHVLIADHFRKRN